jgi:hypothetical protein
MMAALCLLVLSAVLGVCGSRGVTFAVLILGCVFAAAVAGHVGQGGPF